jgi:hypothetical protein
MRVGDNIFMESGAEHAIAEIGCSDGERKFRGLDGEAVAYAAPFFYVVGSHGCSRHSNKFRSSSFILARIPERQVASAARTLDPSSVETTYRLSEALAAIPWIRPYFTQEAMYRLFQRR